MNKTGKAIAGAVLVTFGAVEFLGHWCHEDHAALGAPCLYLPPHYEILSTGGPASGTTVFGTAVNTATPYRAYWA